MGRGHRHQRQDHDGRHGRGDPQRGGLPRRSPPATSGLPLIDVGARPRGYDVIAVELSSFQLHWSRDLAPEVGVVLNLAEDHLDWHGSLRGVRRRQGRRSGGDSGCRPYNADDPLVARAGERRRRRAASVHPRATRARRLRRRRRRDRRSDERLVARRAGVRIARRGRRSAGRRRGPRVRGRTTSRMRSPRPLLPGLRLDAPVPWPAVGAGLRAYRPGRHRNELVATGGGVDWVDDSKATNPHAAAASLVGVPVRGVDRGRPAQGRRRRRPGRRACRTAARRWS